MQDQISGITSELRLSSSQRFAEIEENEDERFAEIQANDAMRLHMKKFIFINDQLKRLYGDNLKLLELEYDYHCFGAPLLTDSEFDAKPMVLVLGQYSAGKTTFMKHLLGRNYRGAVIAALPSTSGFTVVMDGPEERCDVCTETVLQADLPFQWLTEFGGALVKNFRCAWMPHPLLEHLTFIDSPGFASREEEQIDRGYDFCGVIRRLAQKCEMVLVFFDVVNVGRCAELDNVMASLAGYEEKIRIVLNKADLVEDDAQLRQVYAKIELVKKNLKTSWQDTHIGSFEAMGMMDKKRLKEERVGLYAALMEIPGKACTGRVDAFVARARAAKTHAYIISMLEKKMRPSMMWLCTCGFCQTKQLKNLADVFAKVQNELHLSATQLPDVAHYRQVLGGYDWNNLKQLNQEMIDAVDRMIHRDIPEFSTKLSDVCL